ncbi:hypothetical protein FN846DRAFT_994068 [Sphaerosporella brunnea]|uniref:Uncharacterized protein n=1 Tax=Sphaerosporella brunnea TaxID=1250544 RepID=A0A5J5F703_9PEZI|nr:hypothetical protein FN846DRAFT_994068 [Sphaerosporella brunnea]
MTDISRHCTPSTDSIFSRAQHAQQQRVCDGKGKDVSRVVEVAIDRRTVLINPLQPFKHTIADVSPADAASVVLAVQERFNVAYNAYTQRLTLSLMESPCRGAIQIFMHQACDAMVQQDFVPGADFKHKQAGGCLALTSNMLFTHFRGPYLHSSRAPDVSIQNVSWAKNYLPSLVVECGSSQDYNMLLENKDLWLVGGDGRVSCVLIVNVDEGCMPHAERPGIPTARFLPHGTVEGDAQNDRELAGSGHGNADDSADDLPELGFFDDSFESEISEPGADKPQFTGFLELWRFDGSRGSRDRPHDAAVCCGRAVSFTPAPLLNHVLTWSQYMPSNPATRESEYLELTLSDVYGPHRRFHPRGKSRDTVFRLPAIWAQDAVADMWDGFLACRRAMRRKQASKAAGDTDEGGP